MPTHHRPLSRAGPEAVTGMAGDQPGAIPILDGTPTREDLPTDQSTGDPVGETVSFVVTDRSNGSGNVYGFDTVIYEGTTLSN